MHEYKEKMLTLHSKNQNGYHISSDNPYFLRARKHNKL